MIRKNAQRNKTTDLPNGVSRFVEIDKRAKNPIPKIGFGALVYVEGKPKIKKFRVTEGISENHAREAAIYFRLYYESCSELPFRFNFNEFDDWKGKDANHQS